MRTALATLLQPVARPRITTDRELRRYVAMVTAIALVAALSLDGAQQMIFFVSWEVTLRNWTLTTVIVLVVTIPVSLLMGLPQRELYQAKLLVERLSRTDMLTGMLNRRALMEAAEQEPDAATLMAIVDIDHFKRVNDTYGHQAGDRVIETIGRMMSARFEGMALVGRLGGEEFALLADHRSLRRLTGSIEAFRKALQNRPIVVGDRAIVVTVSIGLATRRASDPFDQLYAETDGALYDAKRSGRNQLRLAGEGEANGAAEQFAAA
ncbi:GGDEF domain-containing protein [Hansschlegelia quercus]|uniref:diguanylate cyclase n=1 Tax=Hansschlegelia quercus TaxID=2528245 RepID=A0A4Q9GHY2_9HYPH|nr:diguanylate cyclase [Hansschlegelia quercus]TBN53809.1 GGDEF domain-containing protein [Hansschlegelia quercus]